MLLYEAPEDPHPHVVTVMKGHRLLEQGDMSGIELTFAPDIVWHESGVVPPASAYHGVAEVMAYWSRYFSAAGAGFTQDIVSIMANDEYVTSVVLLAGAKGADVFADTAVDLMRMRDGRIAEFWRYYSDFPRAVAFFSREA